MPLIQSFERLDRALTSFLADYGIGILRISLGIVFLWFGILKFFPGFSSAEYLAGETIETLSFELVPKKSALLMLATLETFIGVALILRVFLRFVLLCLVFQMLGTFTPLFLFPQMTWTVFGVVPTLEGQYIIKNIVLLSAAIVVGATVRGGELVSEPERISPKKE